ncbi:MAG TPA: glycosyltransferase [Planktothrix sp.]|jgi:glycosyltransferase involved in cell wall biosynthesis
MSNMLIACDPPVNKNGFNVGGTHAVVGCIIAELERTGYGVHLVTAEMFGQVPPNQDAYSYLCELLDGMDFNMVHLATQGRICLLVRRYCEERGLPYSTAYHTQIPEYLELRHGISKNIGYEFMRWFCNTAEYTIVPTPDMAETLRANGITNVVSCLHGVDTERFHPVADKTTLLPDLPRPHFLYVGRISPEKSPEDFMRLDLPGTKIVVGGASGGLDQAELEKEYPDVHFAGVQTGDDLARFYASADVFVFPSRTDTFGLVLLEALAAGVPVAAYPVTGPIDVITDPTVGCLDDDLYAAAINALQLSPEACRNFALQHSWPESVSRWLAFHKPFPSENRTFSVRPDTTVPYTLLEKLVSETERMLFASEPAGPYSGKTKVH